MKNKKENKISKNTHMTQWKTLVFLQIPNLLNKLLQLRGKI